MIQLISKSLLLCVLVFGVACAQQSPNKTTKTAVEQVSKYKDISAEQFKNAMADENVVVLDVRTDGEFAAGNIDGAIQINYNASDFDTKIDALDKSKTYLIYCKSGGRSAKACKAMQKKGFTDVSNMLGGYSGWPYK